MEIAVTVVTILLALLVGISYIVSALFLVRAIISLVSVRERQRIARWYVYILPISTVPLLLPLSTFLTGGVGTAGITVIGVLATYVVVKSNLGGIKAAAMTKRWPWGIVTGILVAGLGITVSIYVAMKLAFG